NWCSIIGENIGSFMNTDTSKTSSVPPIVIICVVIVHIEREVPIFKIYLIVFLKYFGCIFDGLYSEITLIIIPKTDSYIFFSRTLFSKNISHCEEYVF